jgi:hypothetical protein
VYAEGFHQLKNCLRFNQMEPADGVARADQERDVGRVPRIFAIIINYLHDSKIALIGF